jgi:hypothetical protein
VIATESPRVENNGMDETTRKKWGPDAARKLQEGAPKSGLSQAVENFKNVFRGGAQAESIYDRLNEKSNREQEQNRQRNYGKGS